MFRILLFTGITIFAICSCTVPETACPYYTDCDTNLSATMATGELLCFELEENVTTGYSWQAEYDASSCRVQIEHLAAANQMPGSPGKAKIIIKALTPGTTVVKLNYTRPFSGEKATELQYNINIK